MSWSIDSLKIRLPLKRVKVIDESIRELIITVSERTGEVLDSQENTKAFRDDRGIKTTFSIENRATKFDNIQYLVILVNAKQLKRQYFEGITKSNVIELHRYLMSLRIVRFSIKELLNSECVDIDFKKDITALEGQIKTAFDTMKHNATPNQDYDKGVKMFWQQDNKGIQFNKRITTSYATAPFLKIYSKTLDLKTKSNIFALAYLDEIPPNLWRIEFTIKNKKHLDMFSISQDLSSLLSISQNQIEAMYQTSLKAVLEQRTREITNFSNEVPPKDLILVNSLIWHLDLGHQWLIIKNNLLGSLKGANRTKKGKLLQTLFDSYIKPINGYSKHQEIDTIMNQIGYTF